MIGDVMKGFTGSLTSGKAWGSALFVVLVLAALYAFFPAGSPEGIAARIRGA